MNASKFSDAQKAFILKQGNDEVSVAEICRKAGISPATYFSWKKKYDGLLPTEMWRFKQLEDENAKLKKLVVDLSLDKEDSRPASSFSYVSRLAASASRGSSACLSCGAGLNFSAIYSLHLAPNQRAALSGGSRSALAGSGAPCIRSVKMSADPGRNLSCPKNPKLHPSRSLMCLPASASRSRRSG
jgi:putative transposase